MLAVEVVIHQQTSDLPLLLGRAFQLFNVTVTPRFSQARRVFSGAATECQSRTNYLSLALLHFEVQIKQTTSVLGFTTFPDISTADQAVVHL